MFTSQLVFEFVIIFGRPSIQVLPAIGSLVYLPVMVGRLMLSIKKAASSQGDGWSFGEPTINTSIRFAERRSIVGTGDEIHLGTFFSGDEEAQSRARN